MVLKVQVVKKAVNCVCIKAAILNFDLLTKLRLSHSNSNFRAIILFNVPT